MHRKILSNLKGQTLIETVIALAVVLILVSALISVSIASVRSATLSKNKTTAAQLAYSESELVRQVRDVTYASKWSGVGSFTASFTNYNCAVSCSVNPTGPDFQNTTKISSIFTIYLRGTSSATELDYTVYVTWSDSLGSHTETVSSILTPWK